MHPTLAGRAGVRPARPQVRREPRVAGEPRSATAGAALRHPEPSRPRRGGEIPPCLPGVSRSRETCTADVQRRPSHRSSSRRRHHGTGLRLSPPGGVGCGPPFRGGGSDGDPIEPYEFAAHAYGWTPDRIAAEITDEILVDFLGAARKRIAADHRKAIEAHRAGIVFAYNLGAYRQWNAANRDRVQSPGLKGADLERAVAALGSGWSGIVKRETVPAEVLAARRAAFAATPLVPWNQELR